MVWKRLNDHGKNWRHVYKSLVLLEYLVKNGSERVVRQCVDNLFSIQTLKDFQFLDKDGKDQGSNGKGGLSAQCHNNCKHPCTYVLQTCTHTPTHPPPQHIQNMIRTRRTIYTHGSVKLSITMQ